MKCTNNNSLSSGSELKRAPRKGGCPASEISKNISSYDSLRTDSGYSSCTSPNVSSMFQGTNLNFQDSTTVRQQQHSAVSQRTTCSSELSNIGDSGISIDSVCESSDSAPTTLLNDLNKETKGVCSSTTDSGLGLEIHDNLSKLSITGEQESSLRLVQDNFNATNELNIVSKVADNNNQCYSIPKESLFNLDSHKHWIQSLYHPDKDGDTALHLSIVRGRLDIIFALIYLAPHPGYLDLQNNLYQTALHLAVLTNQPKVVRRLVLAGASLDIRNKIGNTPLHLACERGDFECVKELTRPISSPEMHYMRLTLPPTHRMPYVSLPQNLELRNYEGQMCVHLAAMSKHVDIVRHLKMYGANINAQEGKAGRTPLWFAVESRNLHLVEILVNECGADSNAATYAGITPFHLALGLDYHIAEILKTFGACKSHPSYLDSDTESESSLEESMDTSDELSSYLDLKINGEPLW